MQIRNSAKAVILQDEKLLAIKKESQQGVYYVLPGGGQEHGENLHQTLQRECIEEINADVGVDNLLFIREYIGRNHEFLDRDVDVHQTEYMFICNIKEGSKEIGNGIIPDDGQVGVEWLKVTELLKCELYPRAMREKIIAYLEGEEVPVYLGDIN